MKKINSYFLITRKKIPVYLKYYWSKITSEIKTKVEGIPPIILLKSSGKNLINYLIYGNSIQNGTPTPFNPIEIESVGDLIKDTNDINYGKYKIPVKVKDTNNIVQSTINIYLDEPLRKIGDYSDYIDFKNSKVVRNIAKKVLNGTEDWGMPGTMVADYSSYRIINFIPNLPLQTPIEELLCTHFEAFPKSQYQQEPIQNKITSYGNTNQIVILVSNNIADSNNQTTIANWINWLSNNNITLYYSKKQPTEETLTLQDIPTIKGTTIIDCNTEIQPSKIEVDYLRRG